MHPLGILISSPGTKLKSNWTDDLNIKPDILDLIEDKVGDYHDLIGKGETGRRWGLQSGYNTNN
jgi:hypothetical protein